MEISRNCPNCKDSRSNTIGFTSSELSLNVTETRNYNSRQRTLGIIEYYRAINICLTCYNLFIDSQILNDRYSAQYFFGTLLPKRLLLNDKVFQALGNKAKNMPRLNFYNMSNYWNGSYDTTDAYFWIEIHRNAENAVKFLILNNNQVKTNSKFDQTVHKTLISNMFTKLIDQFKFGNTYMNLPEDDLDYELIKRMSFEITGWNISDLDEYDGIKIEMWNWGK